MRAYLSQMMTYARDKITNALENISFEASFMPLKLRRESKRDCLEVGESKVGIYRTVSTMCSLEGSYGLFQRSVKSDAQKQWKEFA